MSSPAVAAIRAVAEQHLTAEMSLQERRTIMVQMYREQDWVWIQTIRDLDRRIANEQRQRIQAARDAREIAQAERNLT